MIGRSVRASNGRAGFTLFEVLIAMSLMGMILAFLAAITAYWMPNWDRGIARLQTNEQLALGLERVAADLAAAEFIPDAASTKQVLFSGAPREVVFVRTVLAPHASPGLEFVRIAQSPGESGPALVRTRAFFAPLLGDADNPSQPNFTDPVVLIRAPYQLSFAYAGPDRVWYDTWQQENQLPRMIRITLRDGATDRPLAASTIVHVHAELPMECITAKSLAACPPLSARAMHSSQGGTTGAQRSDEL